MIARARAQKSMFFHGESMLFFAASSVRDLLNGISIFVAKLLNGISIFVIKLLNGISKKILKLLVGLSKSLYICISDIIC